MGMTLRLICIALFWLSGEARGQCNIYLVQRVTGGTVSYLDTQTHKYIVLSRNDTIRNLDRKRFAFAPQTAGISLLDMCNHGVTLISNNFTNPSTGKNFWDFIIHALGFEISTTITATRGEQDIEFDLKEYPFNGNAPVYLGYKHETDTLSFRLGEFAVPLQKTGRFYLSTARPGAPPVTQPLTLNQGVLFLPVRSLKEGQAYEIRFENLSKISTPVTRFIPLKTE